MYLLKTVVDCLAFYFFFCLSHTSMPQSVSHLIRVLESLFYSNNNKEAQLFAVDPTGPTEEILLRLFCFPRVAFFPTFVLFGTSLSLFLSLDFQPWMAADSVMHGVTTWPISSFRSLSHQGLPSSFFGFLRFFSSSSPLIRVLDPFDRTQPIVSSLYTSLLHDDYETKTRQQENKKKRRR